MNKQLFVVSMLAIAGAAEEHFRSGSVSTYEKFQYGKFVTRMKAPDRRGTVASFFTYWDGPNFKENEWNELDMEIVPSVEDNPFSMNIIYGDGHDKVESHDYAHRFNPHDEWHVYEMEWTPHYISWSVDGHEMRHLDLHDPAVRNLHKAQSLRMNFWTPTFHSWGAGFDSVDMPWYVLYDYVEVFTYDEAHNEFKFHWRDDFNYFDSGKWHKASGGFQQNTSVFHPENAYTDHGHLVLKMEPDHSKQRDLRAARELTQSFGLDLDNRRVHKKSHLPDHPSYFNDATSNGHKYHQDRRYVHEEEPEYYHHYGQTDRYYDDQQYDHERPHESQRYYHDEYDQHRYRKHAGKKHHRRDRRHYRKHYDDYDLETTDSEAELEAYRKHYEHHSSEPYLHHSERRDRHHYADEHEMREVEGHHFDFEPIHKHSHSEYKHHGVDRSEDFAAHELLTKEEKLFDDLEPERFRFATETEAHSTVYDRKTAKKEAKRQRKLEQQRRKAEELAALQKREQTEDEEMQIEDDEEKIRMLEADIWHLQEEQTELAQTGKDLRQGYRHVVAPHGSARQKKERDSQAKGLTPRTPKEATTESKEGEATEPQTETSMLTYDEYRLMKHKEKVRKKHAKREFKLHDEMDLHAHGHHDEQVEEPDFDSYAEYKAWKSEQKERKYEEKQLRKDEKYHRKHPHWTTTYDEYSHGGLVPRFHFDEELKTKPRSPTTTSQEKRQQEKPTEPKQSQKKATEVDPKAAVSLPPPVTAPKKKSATDTDASKTTTDQKKSAGETKESDDRSTFQHAKTADSRFQHEYKLKAKTQQPSSPSTKPVTEPVTKPMTKLAKPEEVYEQPIELAKPEAPRYYDPKLLKYQEKQERKTAKRQAKYAAKYPQMSEEEITQMAESKYHFGHPYYEDDDFEPQYHHGWKQKEHRHLYPHHEKHHHYYSRDWSDAESEGDRKASHEHSTDYRYGEHHQRKYHKHEDGRWREYDHADIYHHDEQRPHHYVEEPHYREYEHEYSHRHHDRDERRRHGHKEYHHTAAEPYHYDGGYYQEFDRKEPHQYHHDTSYLAVEERPYYRHHYPAKHRQHHEYANQEYEGEYEREHHHEHLEDRHRRDLYDFDDPMSDSDYDDLDEYSGRYHDEDPVYHPSHHVKRHYSEEQYYHSRDKYFPEDSYHAYGEHQVVEEPREELIAHALGKKYQVSEKKQPAPTVSTDVPSAKPAASAPPTTKPVPAPATAKTTPAPSKPSIREAMPLKRVDHHGRQPHDVERYRHHIAAEQEHGLDHLIAKVAAAYPVEHGHIHDGHDERAHSRHYQEDGHIGTGFTHATAHLDHHYDDRHDTVAEPVHVRERSIEHALPGEYSYHSEPVRHHEIVKDYEPEEVESTYYDSKMYKRHAAVPSHRYEPVHTGGREEEYVVDGYDGHVRRAVGAESYQYAHERHHDYQPHFYLQ